jgi:class 3 adenylate cyclase
VLGTLRLNAEIDVRSVLASIRVPTLVLHRAGDVTVDVANGRAMAGAIDGARFVELAGVDHVPMVGDQDAVLDEVEEFVTGTSSGREPDRVLATVLFTDIVGSTGVAGRLGDRAWRDVLESHNALVRRQLARYRGREVKTVGDGFLATFDGPTRAVQCACGVRDAMPGIGLEVRAGLHTGEVETMGEDVGGIAVHIGARIGALAGPGEVLVSSTVRDLVVGSGLTFTERGEHTLRGVPDPWRLVLADPSPRA